MSKEKYTYTTIEEILAKRAAGAPSLTNNARVDALTDEDIEAAMRDDPDWNGHIDEDWSKARMAIPKEAKSVGTLQSRVQPWMMACFGPEISADKLERGDRFLEEAIELLQSVDYPRERTYALIEYVYGREQGEINQEIGGVMITLAAFCLAHGQDMHEAGEVELARIWTKVEKIRAKQAAKPTGSALPVAISHPTPTVDPKPVAWYRDADWMFNFSRGPDKPTFATSSPLEWQPLYASPLDIAAENARLREALAPFAAEADEHDGASAIFSAEVPISWLRAARAAHKGGAE